MASPVQISVNQLSRLVCTHKCPLLLDVRTEAAMLLYDALYRWSRDAANEEHDWPNTAVSP